MKKQGTLLVGLDLCDDFSQISYFSTVTYEPETIMYMENEEKIPTVLGVQKDTKEWVYGADAIRLANEEKAVYLDHILQKVKEEKSVKIFETEFSADVLLERFLKKVLNLLKREYLDETILKIVVTIEDTDVKLIRGIYQALGRLGIHKNRAMVQSHSRSFVSYALSQKRELWLNDVGLFDFNKKGLYYNQLSINRKRKPALVGIVPRDFTSTLNLEMLENPAQEQKIAFTFENIAKNVLHKQVVSTIYVTGEGFEGEWSEDVLRSLCIGRRVFIGQNLYSKGACYAAREAVEQKQAEEFFFAGDDIVVSEIRMQLYHDAGMEDYVLLKAGQAWYEAENTIDVIVEQEEELEIIIYNVLQRTEERRMIPLEGIRQKPDRTERLRVQLRFIDLHTLVVGIKELGFGSMYPSKHRIWEKTFEI